LCLHRRQRSKPASKATPAFARWRGRDQLLLAMIGWISRQVCAAM
jgi:hypothetical protein